MTSEQQSTIKRMVTRFKNERNLGATYDVRMSGSYVYVQFHVRTPDPFPELRVGAQGGWWSDQIRSYPNPAMDSLLYADQRFAKQNGSARRHTQCDSTVTRAITLPRPASTPPQVTPLSAAGVGGAVTLRGKGDRFLEVCGVWNEESAMSNALQAALGRNPTYRDGDDSLRPRFRREWASLIRSEAPRYRVCVSDSSHCDAIRAICDRMSERFGHILWDGRLRVGTSQKALNLYLKFLWRLGKADVPPHCPVDSIILTKAGISGAWTKCDDFREYMGWVNTLRARCKPLSLAEWEYGLWMLSAAG